MGRIVFEIKDGGKVKITPSDDIVGARCVDLTRPFEQALGSKVTSDEELPSMHATEAVEETLEEQA